MPSSVGGMLGPSPLFDSGMRGFHPARSNGPVGQMPPVCRTLNGQWSVAIPSGITIAPRITVLVRGAEEPSPIGLAPLHSGTTCLPNLGLCIVHFPRPEVNPAYAFTVLMRPCELFRVWKLAMPDRSVFWISRRSAAAQKAEAWELPGVGSRSTSGTFRGGPTHVAQLGSASQQSY